MKYREEMQDLFFGWLKIKGVLDEYCREYMLQNRDMAWTDRIAHLEPFEYADHPIRWRFTSNGYEYWNNINTNWNNYLKATEGKKNDYIIEHNGVKYSEKTLRSILDKFAK